MSHADDTTGAGTRRDFLYYATAGAGAVATGAAVWPLVNQMNPSADVQALASIFVDVSAVEPGTQLTVKWLGKPVFIRRRGQDEIDAGRKVALSDLVDTNAENANIDATATAEDQNRTLDDGSTHEVLKNFPSHLQLQSVAEKYFTHCKFEDDWTMDIAHYWYVVMLKA